jgi:hypothetical protein
MSLAAKEVYVISRYLFNHSSLDLQRRLYWLLLEPWLITESEAYRHAQMRCRRNVIHRIMQWFAGNIYELSSLDEEVHAHLSKRISSFAAFRDWPRHRKQCKIAPMVAFSRLRKKPPID